MAWPCNAWHGIWYGLAGMVWYMVWPSKHVMVYGMAWWGSHGVWYGMAGLAWYIVRPSGHRLVLWYCLICLVSLAWDMVWPCGHRMRITCFKALPWTIVPFTRRVADVCWRSCSHVSDPFTIRGPFKCMFSSHVQLLFTLGRDSR